MHFSSVLPNACVSPWNDVSPGAEEPAATRLFHTFNSTQHTLTTCFVHDLSDCRIANEY